MGASVKTTVSRLVAGFTSSPSRSLESRGGRWLASSKPMRSPTLYGVMIVAAIGLHGVAAEGGSIVLGHKYSARALERLEAHDLKFYLQMLARRSHDPSGFDHRHPLVGDALSKPGSFEYWFDRWQADPARFEHWHPRFWHLLHGEALGSVPVAPPPPLMPPAEQSPDPPTPPGPGGPGDNPPSGGHGLGVETDPFGFNAGIPAVSVPAPASARPPPGPPPPPWPSDERCADSGGSRRSDACARRRLPLR